MTLTTSSANRKDINTANRGVSLEHRHFSFIASVIAETPRDADGHYYAREQLAERFADACRRTNPRFDRSRFLAACGVEQIALRDSATERSALASNASSRTPVTLSAL